MKAIDAKLLAAARATAQIFILSRRACCHLNDVAGVSGVHVSDRSLRRSEQQVAGGSLWSGG